MLAGLVMVTGVLLGLLARLIYANFTELRTLYLGCFF